MDNAKKKIENNCCSLPGDLTEEQKNNYEINLLKYKEQYGDRLIVPTYDEENGKPILPYEFAKDWD